MIKIATEIILLLHELRNVIHTIFYSLLYVYIINMGESWVTKPSELLTKENLKYFVPTDDMTYFEKINTNPIHNLWFCIAVFS